MAALFLDFNFENRFSRATYRWCFWICLAAGTTPFANGKHLTAGYERPLLYEISEKERQLVFFTQSTEDIEFD